MDGTAEESRTVKIKTSAGCEQLALHHFVERTCLGKDRADNLWA